MKKKFQSTLIKTEKSKNHTFRYENLYSSPSKHIGLEGSRPTVDFVLTSHKLILGNT